MAMSRAVFVDTSRTARGGKRRRKPHVCYDGEGIFKVGELTKLKDYDEVFIDTLFPEIYDEVLELLRRGVRVYLLKDARKLKKLRMENNMRKSDENDAILLARIPREKFRQLTIEKVEIKVRIGPLIRRYRLIMRWKSTLKRLIKRGLNYNFEGSLRLMDVDRHKIAQEIIKQVMTFPTHREVYRKASKMLRIKKSAELAILVIELPLHLPLADLKGLLGLIPGRNGGRYHHRLRAHVAALATSLYIRAKKGANVLDEVAKIINNLPKKQAIPKLELLILKTLRMAYLMTVKPLAGE